MCDMDQLDYVRFVEDDSMYRTFFERSRDAIVLVSKDGRFITMNQAYLDLFGYTREELVGKEVMRVYLDPSDRKSFQDEIEVRGFVRDYEGRFRRKNGSIIDCVSNTAVWRSNLGEVMGYWGIIRDVTERKQNERRIQRYQAKLRALTSKLSLAEEKERRRIAADLHDSVGQSLSLCFTKLVELRKSLSSPEKVIALDDVTGMIEHAIRDIQSLIFEISPPILYDLGLAPAVEWLLEQFHTRHGFTFRFERDGDCEAFDIEVKVLLFHAIRELLINVAKHARTHEVYVELKRVQARIQVTVADSGIGFEWKKNSAASWKNGGFGLFNIGDRLDGIGGSMKIASRPGGGTKVILSIPVKQKRRRKKNHD